jgi:hypothetical protein
VAIDWQWRWAGAAAPYDQAQEEGIVPLGDGAYYLGRSSGCEPLLTIERLEREFKRLAVIRRRHRLLALASAAYDFKEAYQKPVGAALALLILGWFIPSPFIAVWPEPIATPPVWADKLRPIRFQGAFKICRSHKGLRHLPNMSRLTRCDRLILPPD